VSGGLLAIVGLAGLPNDLENWGAAFQAIGSELGRWLLVIVGLGVIAAVATSKARRSALAQGHSKEQSEPPAATRPLTYGDLTAMRVPVDENGPGVRVYGGAAVREAVRDPVADSMDTAMQQIREMFERSERKKCDLAEAEFVAMIAEGEHLLGNAFSGNPQWGDFTAWRDPIAKFVGFALGETEEQRLLETGRGQPEVRGHIREVLDWLRERRDNPDKWESRVAQLDGPDLEAAIATRRNGEQAKTLADQLDALMREGMELLDELMAPAQAEETGEGEWALEFGDAPPEWNDKANAFYKTIKDLLAAEHPALIPDFEKGYNERLRIQRERRKVARERPDNRSQAQRTLDFATDTQRTPAKVVEACLEGLSQARKAI
jgi:hypothetical protein